MKKILHRKILFTISILILAISLSACTSESPKIQLGKKITTTIKDEPIEKPEDKYELDEGVEKKKKFEHGIYQVGREMPAGEYKVYPMERTGLFRISSGRDEDQADDIGGDYLKDFGYVTVSNGQYLHLMRAYAIPVDLAEPFDPKDGYKDGEYKVGVDIPPGGYKMFSQDGRGYFRVNKDSKSTPDSMNFNQNFESFIYITISEGQYFQLLRAYALPIEEVEAFDPKDGYRAGEYRVGIDIPAGEYTVKKEDQEELGLVRVYSDLTKEDSSKVLEEFFQTDTMEIKLNEGELLWIKYAYIE